MLRAIGISDAEFKIPWVGIINTWNLEFGIADANGTEHGSSGGLLRSLFDCIAFHVLYSNRLD